MTPHEHRHRHRLDHDPKTTMPEEASVSANPEAIAAHDGRSRRGSQLRGKRRANILRAAVSVFSTSGYHQTRVADIIDAAGIARGTFYLYFQNKNAIFLELLDDLLLELRKSVVGVDSGPDSPDVYTQLCATVAGLLGALSANRSLAMILLREAVGLDDEVDKKLGLFYDNLHHFITDALATGQRIGFIRKLQPGHDDIVATCILGSIRQVLDRYLVRDDALEHDLEGMARAIVDHNFRGLMA